MRWRKSAASAASRNPRPRGAGCTATGGVKRVGEAAPAAAGGLAADERKFDI